MVALRGKEGGEGKKRDTKRQERGRKPGGKEVDVIIKNKFNVLKSKEALCILRFWRLLGKNHYVFWHLGWVRGEGGGGVP